jgi:hypothetical protein
MRKFHLWIIFTVDNATRRFARGDLTLVAGAQMAARGDSAKWATGVCRSAMFAAGYAAAAVHYARVGASSCRRCSAKSRYLPGYKWSKQTIARYELVSRRWPRQGDFRLVFAASVLFNLAAFRRATPREIDSGQSLTSRGGGAKRRLTQ